MDKYRSLVAWQVAHQLAVAALRTTDRGNRSRYWSLFDQIRRAAVSVEANIVEGYALGTTPQFRRHLRIALASAAEVECLVRTARELEYLPHARSQQIENLTGRAMRSLYGLLRKAHSPKP